MTAPPTGAAPGDADDADDAGDPAARDLLLRVLGALLREDVVGLRSRSAPVERADGLWLRLPVHGKAGGALLLPVTEDGFQSRWTARLPLLLVETGAGTEADAGPDGGRALTSYGDVLDALKALADPADRAGFDAFARECRQTLATVRLHARTRQSTAAALRKRHGADPARWTGLAGGLAHDTLAARHDHPVYPAARGRSGLHEAQLRSYAPEFHPRFALRWLAVPRAALTCAGDAAVLAERSPSPALLGLPRLADSHLALPVHPLTAGAPLRGALEACGLAGRAVLAGAPRVEVVPTLSMRTVALASDPALHLKLPLATATLGLRNRRTIKPGTLADGAVCQRLLETVTAREPRFRATILLADETAYAHAGHELLAVLCRRYPAGLDDAVVTPMAALLSEAPGDPGKPAEPHGPGGPGGSGGSGGSGGGMVIDRLADRFYGGDPVALFDACLTLLLDWQTTLLGHGIALESHQQNVSLVLDHDSGGRTRLRLLLKDNDGPRLHASRMRASLGAAAPGPADFDDARILTEDDGPLLALFTTVTVHLCAGAYAYGLARRCRAPLATLLTLIRDRLSEAASRLGTAPGQPGALLRSHVLDAPELPVKAMVTAGTLLTKERSGAADINKHYTTGPNYLRGIVLPPPHPRSLRIRWSR